MLPCAIPAQVVARFAGRTVRGVLMAWRGAVHAKERRRDVLAVAAGRLRNRQLGAAFSRWRAHVEEAQVGGLGTCMRLGGMTEHHALL